MVVMSFSNDRMKEEQGVWPETQTPCFLVDSKASDFHDALLAGGKQVIPHYKAQNDNDDGKKIIGDKEHNRHSDAQPE